MRKSASASAMMAMAMPPTSVSCRLTTKPRITVGKTSFPYSISKKVLFTDSHPGDVTRTTARVPRTRTVETRAINLLRL